MRVQSILSSVAMIMISTSASASEDQCYGYTPQPSLAYYLGASLDYSTAERICCNNHKWAEYKGYLAAPEVDFFGRLDPNNETIFYDSVCGLPLFIAPRGRSFEEFKEESLYHGWPSFRPEEMVSENVIIHSDGRMESRCLTHLGHNLPEGGVDRYCIDLVCMAGEPLSVSDERYKILQLLDESVIVHDELNATEYESKAEEWSGNYTDRSMIITIVAVVVASAIVAAVLFAYAVKWKKSKKDTVKEVEQEDVHIEDLS